MKDTSIWQKQSLLQHSRYMPARKALWLLLPVVAIIQLAWLKSYQNSDTAPKAAQTSQDGYFRWANIVPSEKLQYQDCYSGLQCARLTVPLDYSDTNEGAHVALAVIRRPARVPFTHPNYGGAIVTNPGGPGGSGVAQQLLRGQYIQEIADSDQHPDNAGPADKYYDIVSFDPRGVNHTTPTIGCFPDNAARQRWDLQSTAEGLLGSSSNSLRTKWRRAKAVAEGCSKRLGKFREHVNTTPVARDIVEIIERHAQWRETHVRDNIEQSTSVSAEDREQTLKRTAWKPDAEPILYWGNSYGTLLGSTLASMYPSRVERMVLDGNVDSDDYYSGSWTKNLADTDAILQKFMDYCSQAGPSGCAFYHDGGPSAVYDAYTSLLSAIHHDPLAVPGTPSRGPDLITWTDIKVLVSPSLYLPMQYFPLLAELLQDVKYGNGSAFADYKLRKATSLCSSGSTVPEEVCDKPFSHACILPGWSPYDASSAVLCTDAPPEAIEFDEAFFAEYWATLQHQSSSMGDFWAQTRLSCAGWDAKAKWRFQGPIGGKTKHGLLFIGNTLDPVTPLANARRMQQKFEGSGLLQQNSEGHCSSSAPSRCTAKVIRRYFQTGQLPNSGMVCEPDRRPLIGSQKSEVLSASDAALGRMLEEAAMAFSEEMHTPRLPL